MFIKNSFILFFTIIYLPHSNSQTFVEYVDDAYEIVDKKYAIFFREFENQNHLERTGDITFYFIEGKVRVRGHYKNGLKNGLFTYYYQNGHIESRVTYVNDQTEGKVEIWYENGQRQEIGFMLKNESRDENTIYFIDSYWDPTGRKLINKGTGEWYSFYDSGAVKSTGQYLDRQRHGIWRTYNCIGEVTSVQIYEYGKIRKYASITDENERKIIYSDIYQPGYTGRTSSKIIIGNTFLFKKYPSIELNEDSVSQK